MHDNSTAVKKPAHEVALEYLTGTISTLEKLFKMIEERKIGEPDALLNAAVFRGCLQATGAILSRMHIPKEALPGVMDELKRIRAEHSEEELEFLDELIGELGKT